MANVITGGKTVFENLLFDALLLEKGRTYYPGRGHVYTIETSSGKFSFSTANDIHAGLPTKIDIHGPVYERSSSPKGEGFLGYLEVETGKIKAGRSSTRDKSNTEVAVEYFLANRAGIDLSQLGWDVSYSEGWARLFKRKPGSIIKKEIAIIAASMPGRQLDLYSADGKHVLGYQETQALKIPPSIYRFVREQTSKDRAFEALYQAYTTVGRRVSAWEDGPGYKYFRKEG